jgi:hypothetical protein
VKQLTGIEIFDPSSTAHYTVDQTSALDHAHARDVEALACHEDQGPKRFDDGDFGGAIGFRWSALKEVRAFFAFIAFLAPLTRWLTSGFP